ncbi:MAG: hypothetical protein Q7J27_02995 [Syntrophales bacterium]|nr:hypothetical protein [Syntrophales bacterium]
MKTCRKCLNIAVEGMDYGFPFSQERQRGGGGELLVMLEGMRITCFLALVV